MKYYIDYYFASNKGNYRKINQDNYSCNAIYMEKDHDNSEYLIGRVLNTDNVIMAVFDGLGGEEKGEDASYIAAKYISEYNGKINKAEDIKDILNKVNEEICRFAEKNNVKTMGTTAALLGFKKDEIILSNIGDSKIFRFSGGKLEQISKDHTTVGMFGMKPPLSQFLGIPPEEMMIVPYMAQGYYNAEDIYIICSDGLTDMVSTEYSDE